MSADDFNKFLHQRGIRREGDMKRLEDHLRQSFKVLLFALYFKFFIFMHIRNLGGKIKFG